MESTIDIIIKNLTGIPRYAAAIKFSIHDTLSDYSKSEDAERLDTDDFRYYRVIREATQECLK